MNEPSSFRDVIGLWPSREAMAAEVGASAWQVSKWWQRRNIPAEWWDAIKSSETGKTSGVTADLLTSLAARPTEISPAEVRA